MVDLGRCYGLGWTARHGSTCDNAATHDLDGYAGIPGLVLCCACFATVQSRRLREHTHG